VFSNKRASMGPQAELQSFKVGSQLPVLSGPFFLRLEVFKTFTLGLALLLCRLAMWWRALSSP
jgi:hypothetical protein